METNNMTALLRDLMNLRTRLEDHAARRRSHLSEQAASRLRAAIAIFIADQNAPDPKGGR